MNNNGDNFSMKCLKYLKMDEWKKKLKDYLSNKTEKIKNLYIITKELLDNYEKRILTQSITKVIIQTLNLKVLN